MLQIEATQGEVPFMGVFGGDALSAPWSAVHKAQWKKGFCTAVPMENGKGATVYLHWGDPEKWTLRKIKELCAAMARAAQALEATACTLPLDDFMQRFGTAALWAAAQGVAGGLYCFSRKTDHKKKCIPEIYAIVTSMPLPEAKAEGKRAWALAEEICFAKNMVNEPGNTLRPEDFAKEILARGKDLPVEAQVISYETLVAQGYAGLVGVGGSSAFKPCMVLLRYHGVPTSKQRLGIAGKGVTCDTGGYCIKSAASMKGIKGDMAGAAASVAALYALAASAAPVNVTVCLPLCENRIAPDAMVPGDVLTLYGGKTVEILNTDAEGRLILADAVAHLAQHENVTQIVDIATLTGAAWSAFGYTMAPVLCDDDGFYETLLEAQKSSAECFVRIPFGEEHEKMISSDVADLKNIGGDCCGAITAGLFMRPFAKNIPWMHLDIAGTAWVSAPSFPFESIGATGAGAATLYHLALKATQAGKA